MRAVALGWTMVWAMVSAVAAHEVRPTIGDLTYRDGALVLELQLNVEAFVAGIDLDGLQDTNVVPEAEAYDALRALSPDDLATQFAPVADTMGREITLDTGADAPVPFAVDAIDVGPTGDPEALRDSLVVLRADVGRVGEISLNWPQGYGTLILRQTGGEDAYTGFLEGGFSSGPIDFSAAQSATGWGALWDVLFGWL